jgi:flagellar secretion chaperone FliS
MLAAYARSQYEEMQVQTTPGRLVVMLYDGALRFLHMGRDALLRSELEAQGLNLGKAQNILCELITTLDMAAGEVAQNLLSIYHYCLERLLRANAEDRVEYIDEVIRLLSGLRDAWEYAERAVHSSAPSSGAAAPALVGAAG